MKILAIMGSPRGNGNTAEILNCLQASAQGDDRVEIVSLCDYKIQRCTGCSNCQKDTVGFACVQKDDGNLLLGKIRKADAVLYGTPLYGHNYSGQLKIFLNRHLPLFKFAGGKENAVDEIDTLSAIENKPVGLLVSCQRPEENNKELVKQLFDKFCGSSLAACFGKYVFPFCNPDISLSFYDLETVNRIFEDIHKTAYEKNVKRYLS